MGLADGSMDDEQRQIERQISSSDQFQRANERPEAYVSVFDPVGEPAFKASQTKPLPRWMNLLPSNMHRDMEHDSLDFYSSDGAGGGLIEASPRVFTDIPGLQGVGHVQSSSAVQSSIFAEKARKRRRKTTVSFELQLTYASDHSRHDDGRCHKRGTDDSVNTPLQSDSCSRPPPRRNSPFPQSISDMLTVRKAFKHSFGQSRSLGVTEERTVLACCVPGHNLQANEQKEHTRHLPCACPYTGYNTFLASSENLDTYKRTSSWTANAQAIHGAASRANWQNHEKDVQKAGRRPKESHE